MKRLLLLPTVAVAVLLAGTGVVLAQDTATPSPSAEAVIPGQYIVVLKDGVSDPRAVARDHAQRYGAQALQNYQYAIKGYAAKIPSTQLDKVRSDARVQFVSENREFQLAPFDLTQGDPYQEQVLSKAVDRIEADQSSARSGNGSGSVNVGIAVIDSGIDRGHEDLNVVGGQDCASTSGGAFVDNDNHGTFVAGLAAAKDNDIGAAGVAPGAPLYSVKVYTDKGKITESSILCGIDWVTANGKALGIKVVNMSITGNGSDDSNCGTFNKDALHKAICKSVHNAGVTYVISAGNDNKNFNRQIPAAYEEVLTATAMADSDGMPGGLGPPLGCMPEEDDTEAFFSNFATPASADARHTIAAPGVCVGSTLPDNNYASSSGTSFSAPLVAGTAALYKARYPRATPQQVMEALLTEAQEMPPSYGFKGDPHRAIADRYYGYLVHAGDF